MSAKVYFECANCNKKFSNKGSLTKHVKRKICSTGSIECDWCKLKFTNQGNLRLHRRFMHKESKSQSQTNRQTCIACGVSFVDQLSYRYHVRRIHFNLHSKAPLYEIKKLNQVWCERVLNTNDVIEIKKKAHNTLVLRRVDQNSPVKNSDETEDINLVDLYPLGRHIRKVLCTYCNKKVTSQCIKKHVEEFHLKLVKHKCNNCNMEFKRSYAFLKHVCNKKRKRRKDFKDVTPRTPIINLNNEIEEEKIEEQPEIIDFNQNGVSSFWSDDIQNAPIIIDCDLR